MQAEGGASLSDAEPQSPAPRVSRTTLLLVGVAATALLLDQVSKAVIVATMAHREPIELLWGFTTITYIRNPGAAFSVGTGATWLFTGVAVVVVVVILRTSRRLRSIPWAICLGGLLGGALGNLTDRVFRSPGHLKGHVVDWIQWPHYPVFNVADCFVVCSVIGIVLLSVLGYELDGGRTGWAARRAAGGAG
jgi:signal peptidase II